MLKNSKFVEFLKRNQKVAIFISIILLSFIVYSPSFINPNFFWDDERFIFMNPALLQAPNWYIFWNIKSEFFKSWPVGYSIFWLLIKNSPLTSIFFYKSLNIIFHGINAYLVYILNKKLKLKHPYWLSLIFLLHALHVETVSWIFQLLTILCLTFFLCSLLFLIKYLERERYYFLIFSFLFFALSLWTKSIAIFAPFLFLTFFGIYKTDLKKYFLLFPYFLISFYIGFINISGTAYHNKTQATFSNNILGFMNSKLENLFNSPEEKIQFDPYFDYIYTHSGDIFHYTPMKVFNQSVWHYTKKLFLPINLNFIYDDIAYNLALTIFSVFLLIVVPTIIYFKSRNKYLILIPAMTLVFLLPYIGITEITFFYWSNVSDRYTYFFVIVLVVILGLAGSYFTNNNFKKILISYCVILSILSFWSGLKFNHPIEMYSKILEYKPHPVIYSLLFEQYYISLDVKNADETLQEGLRKFPDHPLLVRDIMRSNALKKFYKDNY